MNNIVQPNAPLVGKDGRITRDWYLFLLELFNLSGGGSTSVIEQNVFQEYTFQQNNSEGSEMRSDFAAAQAILNATRAKPTQQLEQRIAELETLFRGAHRNQEVQRLTQRVADLEARIQAVRPSAPDQRTAEAVSYIFARR